MTVAWIRKVTVVKWSEVVILWIYFERRFHRICWGIGLKKVKNEYKVLIGRMELPFTEMRKTEGGKGWKGWHQKFSFGYIKFKMPIRQLNGELKEKLDIQVWSQGRGYSWRCQWDNNLRVVSTKIRFKPEAKMRLAEHGKVVASMA